MSVDNNINLYYEELVQSMAERAKDSIVPGGYEDETDAIWQAIDNSLMFYSDVGYVLAMATCRGYIEWNKDVNWDEISEMLYEDVSEELENLKKENK